MDGVSSPSLDVNRSRAGPGEKWARTARLQCRDSLTACTVRASARSPPFSSQPPLRLAARTRRPAPAPPDGARLGPPPRCGERRPLLLRAALLPPPPLAPPPPLDSRRRCLYSHACCDQAAPRLRAPLGACGRGDARSRRLGGGGGGGAPRDRSRPRAAAHRQCYRQRQGGARWRRSPGSGGRASPRVHGRRRLSRPRPPAARVVSAVYCGRGGMDTSRGTVCAARWPCSCLLGDSGGRGTRCLWTRELPRRAGRGRVVVVARAADRAIRAACTKKRPKLTPPKSGGCLTLNYGPGARSRGVRSVLI